MVDDADAGGRGGDRARRPVALKASAPGLVHKTDAGGVRLGLEARTRCAPPPARSSSRSRGPATGSTACIVQPMAPAGVELIVGVVHDHSFGPVLACGAGGTTAELVSDVAVRITPVTDLEAREMVHSLHTFPLLDGYRGAPRPATWPRSRMCCCA